MDNTSKSQPRPSGGRSIVLRAPKLLALVVAGPLLFIFIAVIAPVCHKRSGFRGWFWRRVKRACSALLWLLDIKAEMTPAACAAIREDENSIIMVNHRSNLDGFSLMDTIPDEKWFTFAAKKELFDSGLLKRGFVGAGLVEIDRKKGKHALDTLIEAVRDMPKRRSVVLFAEGTRTRTDTLGEFKPGGVLAARETGRAIRPIVIKGSDTLLPRGKTLPRTGTVQIEVLPLFHCVPERSVDEDLTHLREEMRKVFEGEQDGL